jgi:urease accessory protein
MAAARVWDAAAFLAEHAGPVHHAPVFGALAGTLGLAPDDACAIHLHGTARNVLSAAVRLGALGPLEAQKLHAESRLGVLLESVRDLDVADAAGAAPILELHAQLHERLDGRLFQS